MQSSDTSFHRSAPYILLICLIAGLFVLPSTLRGSVLLAFDTLNAYLPWSAAMTSRPFPHNPLITDPVNFFHPERTFGKTTLQQGAIPYWYNLTLCGTPFSPDGSLITYLLNLLLPYFFAHNLILLFHLGLAGVGLFLFLRRKALSAPASFIGAIAWMFNGYVMVWFEFEHLPITASMLPVSLLLVDELVTESTLPAFLGLAAVISYTVSSAHPHFLVLQGLLVAAYAGYRAIAIGVKGEAARFVVVKRTVVISMAAAVGLLLSMETIAVDLDGLMNSERSRFTFGELFEDTGRLPWGFLTTLLFPNFFGGPTLRAGGIPPVHGSVPYNNYNELCLFAGAMTLSFALVALSRIGARKGIGFFGAVGIYALVASAEPILYYPLWRFVPGLNLSTPTRLLYLFAFCVSVLAGMGADALQRRAVSGRVVALVASVIVVLCGILLSLSQSPQGLLLLSDDPQWAYGLFAALRHFGYNELFSPALLKPALLCLTSSAVLVGLVIAESEGQRTRLVLLSAVVILVDLVPFGWDYNTRCPQTSAFPETPGIRFLKRDSLGVYRVGTLGNFMPNGLAAFNIEDVGGYSSVYPRRYGEFWHAVNTGSDSLPGTLSRWLPLYSAASPLLDLANMRFLMTDKRVEASDSRYRLVYDGEIRVFENTTAFPRAFFVSEARICATGREAYRTLVHATAADLRRFVVLEAPQDQRSSRDEFVDSTASSTVEIAHYGSNSMRLSVHAAVGGYVVISNSFHAGWRALVDGVRAPVMRADYAFQAVMVTRGAHEVTLSFQPTAVMVGTWVTIVSWGLLVLYSLAYVPLLTIARRKA